jgi:hypothetical protein
MINIIFFIKKSRGMIRARMEIANCGILIAG